MSELKPCPFCGGTTAHFHEGSTFRWLVIECDECGATPGEVRVQTLGNGTPDDWRKQGEADAIAAWNRRHEITPQAGEPFMHWLDPETNKVIPLYRTAPPRPVAPVWQPPAALLMRIQSWRSGRQGALEEHEIYSLAVDMAEAILSALPPDSPGATEES